MSAERTVKPDDGFLANLGDRIFRRKIAAALILGKISLPDLEPEQALMILSDLYVVSPKKSDEATLPAERRVEGP